MSDGAKLVPVEVEVLFFNLSRERGLLTAGLSKGADGKLDFPHDRMRPGEQPVECAMRILSDLVRLRTAVHEPLLVDAVTYDDVNRSEQAVTIVFTAIGRRPDDYADPWVESIAVDTEQRTNIRHLSTLDAARSRVIDLMTHRPVAIKLLDRPNEPFTAESLHTIYSAVLGLDYNIDSSNFRRSIARTSGFVERVAGPHSVEGLRRGRPPNWYVSANGERIEPPLVFHKRK